MIDWASVPTPDKRHALLKLAEATEAASPGNPALHLAVGRALVDVGRAGDALERLRKACRQFPAEPGLHGELARVLGRGGDVEAALSIARAWPAEPWSARLALRLLSKHGRFDEARSFEDSVAALDPADHGLIEYRARRLRKKPEQLLRLCESALAHDPGATHAIYYRAIALAQLGRDDEAAAAMALDRFLSVTRLSMPAHESGAEFHGAVRDEILANPTLHADPAGHATRQGLRTGTYPLPGDKASAALTDTIRAAIGSYADALDGDHTFVTGRPGRATFVAWALVFREAGHQLLHHHPEPWLTGVYYVSAPDASPRPGALRIGLLPDWAGVAPPWPVRTIEPEPGTLVLFPSFVPHDTVPTGSAEERISIAFDVNAAD